MKSVKKSRLTNTGLPPGTLLTPSESSRRPVKQTLYSYNMSTCSDQGVQEGISSSDLNLPDSVSWLNVDGVHDSSILMNLGKAFEIHPLVLEDIQNLESRPKMEDHGGYLFFIFKMLRWDNNSEEISAEQVSLIVGKSFVISFQEYEGDVFDSIRHRIRTGTGRIRRENASYLAYALLDSVVDNYFLVLEELENRFEELEENIIISVKKDNLNKVHSLKKQLTRIRRCLWPLQEMLYTLQKEEISLIGGNILPFFRDVHDHSLRLMDTAESLRDTAAGLMELNRANLASDMNSVMKTLTIIATIFIPLTFIAGVYGMNFKFMPELNVVWAYPAVIGVMTAVAVGMILFFRRKKWL